MDTTDRAGPRTEAIVYRFPAGTDQEQISKDRATRKAVNAFCTPHEDPPDPAEADEYRPIQSGALMWPLGLLALACIGLAWWLA